MAVFAIVSFASLVASLVVPAVADCTKVALLIMVNAAVNFACSAAYSGMVARAVAFLVLKSLHDYKHLILHVVCCS
jgi:hypothetical protein